MWFKTNNIKKSSSLIPNLIWILAICLIFLLWIFSIKNINFFDFVAKTGSDLGILNNKKTPKEKVKDQPLKNKINILLVWRWWDNHEGWNLTDTIILASINTKTKKLSMLSVPRDLYVEYPWKDGTWKINWLYAKYKSEKTPNSWIEATKNKITEITWEKIDYFVDVDFQWFKDIIDTIWWIKIEIAEDFVDNRYPDWNWWYKTLTFKKWTWLFDWDNALMYARSRHSTSDFDRSERQQQVIKAIKEKLSWSYFLTSPLKIKELYDVFTKRVVTDLNLTTIVKLAYILNSSNDFKILSSNLNNTCFYWSSSCAKWGFLYTPNRDLFWWASVLLAEWTTGSNLSDYESIQKFSNIVFNFPWVYDENYEINIFNSLKKGSLAWPLADNMVKYWFNIPKRNSIWNTKDYYDKSVIYYNNISANSDTIKALKSFFEWEIIKTDLPKYSETGAKIEIVIWEDYLLNKNQFKF